MVLAAVLVLASLMTGSFTVAHAAQVEAAAEGPAASGTETADFSALADPEVAVALGLSGEQRAEVARILSEREAALAETPADQRAALIAESNEQLAALLLPVQRNAWERLTGADAPRLRFNFRFQPWADVLEWLAAQADLSLVLDAPPPGTFNYTDARRYTLAEAIDLLNSVLLTKGYTLVRRERMLMVLNLADGVPADLVPQVTLDELDERGRFELVRVSFALGGRVPDDVLTEVKPLIGPHGNAVLLPRTGQLLVTETAGKMRAIDAVIQSVPPPEREREPRDRPEPEKPELAVYPLAGLDAEAVREVLGALLPGARIVHDPKVEQLLAHATPSEHAAIRGIFEQMHADHPPEQRPQLQTYVLREPLSQDLLDRLSQLVPRARLVNDPATGRLIAWATPPEQQMLGESLAGLERTDADVDARQLVVYPLRHTDGSAVSSLLASLLPAARVSIETRTGSIVALALPAEHETIRATLDQLEAAAGEGDDRRLHVYPIAASDAATAQGLIAAAAPRAKVTYDAARERLVVMAWPEEHGQVARVLEELSTADADRPLVLRLYTVAADDSTTLTTVLARLLPRAEVSYDATSRRLVVLAREDEHATVETTIAQVADADPHAVPRLEIYPLSPEQRSRVLTALEALASELPGLRTIPDAQTGELAVWARPEQQAVVAELVDKLSRAPEPGQARVFAAYRITTADPASVHSVLATLLPDAQLVLDAKTGTLAAWARPDQHEVIRTTIQQLDADLPEGQRLKLLMHPLGDATPSTVVALLAQLLPGVQVTPDPATRSLVVLARGDDHELIRTAIERLQPHVDPAHRPRLAVYPTPGVDPIDVVVMLRDIVPEARCSGDRATRKVVAWATPEQQSAIADLVARLHEELPEDERPQVVVYSAGDVDAREMREIIRDLYPDVRSSSDRQQGAVTVLATPQQHEAIGSLIERLRTDRQSPREVAAYPLGTLTASTVQSLLARAVPQAQVVTDATAHSVTVWGTEEEHERIERILSELAAAGPGEKQLVVYPLTASMTTHAMSVLSNLVPQARLVADSITGHLTVIATSDEQQQARTAIEQLLAQSGARPTLVVYPLPAGVATHAMSVLPNLVPQARFVNDPTTGSLTVIAAAAEHEQVRAALDSLAAEGGGQRKVVVYPTQASVATAAIGLLPSVIPQARVLIEAGTGNLVAFANDQEHATVRETLAQLEAEGGGQRTLAVYPLRRVTASTAVGLLQSALPGTQVVVDTAADSLVAWATPDQHETIGQLLERLQAEAHTQQRVTEVYPLRNADPAAAMAALRGLVPTAQMAVDTRTSSLVVTATADEQVEVAEAVARLESSDATGLSLEVYDLQTSQPASVLSALQNLFAQRADVRLSLDSASGKLLAWAPASQHELIRGVVDQIEGEPAALDRMQLEVHEVRKADPRTVVEALTSLFSKSPEVRLIPDRRGGKLLALARPEQQATIRATIDQMQDEALEVEVLQLRVLDPFYAELAISKLFDDDRDGNPPRVDSDLATQQLFVRATREQLKEIRELLSKMGEADLSASVAGSDRRLRVIPLGGQSPAALLTELERLWPQLHSNPIRVVTPSAVAPTLRSGASRRVAPAPPSDEPQADRPPAAPPADEPRDLDEPHDVDEPRDLEEPLEIDEPGPGSGGGDAPQGTSAPLPPDDTTRDKRLPSDRPRAQAHDDEAQPEGAPRDPARLRDDTSPRALPAANNHAQPAAGHMPQAAMPPVDASADEPPAGALPGGEAAEAARGRASAGPPAEIVVAAGADTLTIASDDLEALDQFEALIRTLSQRAAVPGGREFTVFQLRSANAAILAEMLDKLFRGFSLGVRGGGPVSIVADERLNALVVQAGRSDLATIESLLEVLDTSEIPETLQSPKARIVRLQNSRAEQVAEVLREVYKTQLTAGASRQQSIPIPRGIPQDLAAALQQFNAAAAGPLLTLSVDVETNALVLLAPARLLEEVEGLIHDLDDEAQSTDRTVRVVPLNSTNVQTVERALEMLMGSSRRSRFRRGYPGSGN